MAVKQVEHDHGKMVASNWAKGKRIRISTLARVDDERKEEEAEGSNEYVTKEELMALGLKVPKQSEEGQKSKGKTCLACGSEESEPTTAWTPSSTSLGCSRTAESPDCSIDEAFTLP